MAEDHITMKEYQEELNKEVLEISKFLVNKLKSASRGLVLEEKEGYIDITIQNIDTEAADLDISTQDNEISIFFGETHFHIGFTYEGPLANMIEQFLKSVFRILEGSDVSYSIWENDNCLGGGICEYNISGNPDPEYWKKGDKLKVVSWYKIKNREIALK
jgi:hypothetical protein